MQEKVNVGEFLEKGEGRTVEIDENRKPSSISMREGGINTHVKIKLYYSNSISKYIYINEITCNIRWECN